MTVAESPSLATLSSLAEALATTSLALQNDEEYFSIQPDGISLLDIKNELLLSYLQNLVFLILFKLRNTSETVETAQDAQQAVHRKLIELRVFLERGVRPLESKLKYQIDSVLRAVESAKISDAQTQKASDSIRVTNGHDEDVSGSDSEDENSDDPDIARIDPTALQTSGPRLLQQLAKSQPNTSSRTPLQSKRTPTQEGIYRPPRLAPTTMPSDPDNRSREPRKQRSQIMNEYIDEELSSTPFAQPSIGSNATILQGGRSGMSLRDRAKERERTEYEEKHFTRLPGESKAERRKARARGEGIKRDVFGGEDWSGLGGLGGGVRGSIGAKKEKKGVLERREKRRATEDGPRGDGRVDDGGARIGEKFERRKKVLEGRDAKRRKR